MKMYNLHKPANTLISHFLILFLSLTSVFLSVSHADVGFAVSNATIEAVVINKPIVEIASFSIDPSSVVSGNPISAIVSLNNRGNTGTNVTVTFYVVNQSNSTAASIAFNPVLILNGEAANITKTFVINVPPGNYRLIANGTYDTFATNSLETNLTVLAPPSVPSTPSTPSLPPIQPPVIVPERSVITTSPELNGEQVFISFFPVNEQVQFYTTPAASNLTAITGVAMATNKEVRESKLIFHQVDALPTDARSVLDPALTLYKQVMIEKVNINDADIKSLSIFFKVFRSWGGGRFDKDSVVFLRFSDGRWVKLPTTPIGSDSSFYYYDAVSPGLSYFVIAAAVKQPLKIFQYPIVTESKAGKMILHKLTLYNPSSLALSGTAAVSGVPSEWLTDSKKSVTIDPFSSVDVTFPIIVPEGTKPTEYQLMTELNIEGVSRSILTLVRVVEPRSSGILIYREITGDADTNSTKIKMTTENTGRSNVEVIEINDRIPTQLLLDSLVRFTTQPKEFADGVVFWTFPLNAGDTRVDEFAVDKLTDLYSTYINWKIDQVNIISLKEEGVVKVEQLLASQFFSITGGKTNLTLSNRGAIPMGVRIVSMLPSGWSADPGEILDTIPARSSAVYSFDVTIPFETTAGTYSSRFRIEYDTVAFEANLPIVVSQTPGLSPTAAGAVAVTPLTAMISAIVIVSAITITFILFRKKEKHKRGKKSQSKKG